MKKRSPYSIESPGPLPALLSFPRRLAKGTFLNLSIVSPAKSVPTSESNHRVQAVSPACSPDQTSSLSFVLPTSSLLTRCHHSLDDLPLAIPVQCSPRLLGPLFSVTLVDETSHSSLLDEACKELHSILRQALLLQRRGSYSVSQLLPQTCRRKKSEQILGLSFSPRARRQRRSTSPD